GNYAFTDLDPNVNYIVQFIAPNGFEISPANQGGNDANDSDSNANGLTACIDLEPGENNPTIDAGIFLPCVINPEVTASSETICFGSEVVLTATGGDQFVWEANNVIIPNATSSTLTVTPSENTTYSVTVTDSTQFDCQAEVGITITVNPITENILTEVTVCEGASYVWAQDGQTYTAADSPVVLNLTDANGCPFTATLTINEFDPATPIVMEVTVCEGASYVWAQDGQTYTAADSPVVLDLTSPEGCAFTATLTINEFDATEDVVENVTICAGSDFTWSQNGETYTAADSPVVIDVTDANGCTYTATLTIHENDVTEDVVENVTICAGSDFTWSQNGETYTAADSPVVIDVTDANGCTYTATLTIHEFDATPDVVTNATVCEGESYTWFQDGETYTSADSPVILDLIDGHGCTYTATLTIHEDEKVKIGNYVWEDANENGLQDEGVDSGVNDVTVLLFQCNGNQLVETTTTAPNPANDEAGYYEFEVCANSGEYYVMFINIPEDNIFTVDNNGDDTLDSDANASGKTNCFEVLDTDILTVDAGIVNPCHLEVFAGDDTDICVNETITLTASSTDTEGLCPGGCVYPILEQERCSGPQGTFEVWVKSNPSTGSFKFNASAQSFETFDNGTAKYVATVSNGIDVIYVDLTYSGYTTSTPQGSPYANGCQVYDASHYEYYTEVSGTLTSQNHGVFHATRMGPAFQIGMGGDVTRLGFGASGWYSLTGGDGTYTNGDVNLALGECQEKGVNYQWSTEDGTIVGNRNQKTISVTQSGTYTVRAINCADCEDFDEVVVVDSSAHRNSNEATVQVYPVPASSNSNVTIELDIQRPNNFYGDSRTLTDIEVVIFDARGRMINNPRKYSVITGNNVINYNVGNVDEGTYIMRVTGDTWSKTSRLIIK
ncbi:MAG: SdrD B-like domain-containing protein, partial [Winogradskyella sp.]|uniref:SdrD B-like domain-containing protein n=1 Tax=Winogradskyella sp. TaxID=1883156 RepID=UPI0038589EC2